MAEAVATREPETCPMCKGSGLLMSSDLRICFVLNGEDVVEPAASTELLFGPLSRVLERSRNVGRPITDWELRRADGTRVDATGLVSGLGWTRGSGDHDGLLFVTLAIGFGGAESESAPSEGGKP